MSPKISIIAPVYNEEDVIQKFIKQTLQILRQFVHNFELILIDDGSTDNTLEICKSLAIEHPEIQVLVFSRNYGHEFALTAGIDHCSGDFAITMDTDLQHPPELIPQLIQKAQEGYDIVNAKRSNRNTQSWLKRKTAQLFYRFASKLTGFELDGSIGNYKILSRKVINALKEMKENSRHMLMMFAYIGYKTAEIPYECQERAAGDSKYNYRKLINLAIDSIISFSHRPLRYMSILSIAISLILTGYAGFIVLEKLFYNQQLAEGVASVIFITSGLFAVLFFFLAIISEYISRILIESKGRPLYYIREVIKNEEKSN
jgi:dolichol-phosphate mannosyltransferase